MKISIHQPNFMPWIPFFKKIEWADIFVILIECQFEKNNFQNRFNIGETWYTMSVAKGNDPIKSKTYISPFNDWNKIKSKLPQYEKQLSLFDDCISDNLSKTNIEIIKRACEILNIKTKIVLDYETDLKSTERLVDICKHFKATEYLSGSSGKNYLDIEKFGDIKVSFQTTINEDKIILLEAIKNATNIKQ